MCVAACSVRTRFARKTRDQFAHRTVFRRRQQTDWKTRQRRRRDDILAAGGQSLPRRVHPRQRQSGRRRSEGAGGRSDAAYRAAVGSASTGRRRCRLGRGGEQAARAPPRGLSRGAAVAGRERLAGRERSAVVVRARTSPLPASVRGPRRPTVAVGVAAEIGPRRRRDAVASTTARRRRGRRTPADGSNTVDAVRPRKLAQQVRLHRHLDLFQSK